MNTKKISLILSLFTISLLIGSTFAYVTPFQYFPGNYTFTRNEYTIAEPLEFGFHVSLFSTLSMPVDWTLQYTMGFYLMNEAYDGYFVGFHQVLGAAKIYVGPVDNKIAYGLDGQAVIFDPPTHEPLQYNVASLNLRTVTLNLNYTTGLFELRENGNLLIQNDFSGSNFNLTNYAVTNVYGRQQINGEVYFSAWGPDFDNGTYTIPVTTGVTFKTITDNVVDDTSGGVTSWASNNFLGTNPQDGTEGQAFSLVLNDNVVVTGTPNAGYSFASFYMGTSYTGGEFYPAGYYDYNGRLIANPTFTHLYITEPCTIAYGFNSFYPDHYILINSTHPQGAVLYLVDQPYYTEFSIFELWLQGQELYNYQEPTSAGIVTQNPFNFLYQQANITVYGSFTSINFDPSYIAYVTPSPSPGASATPTTPTYNVDGLGDLGILWSYQARLIYGFILLVAFSIILGKFMKIPGLIMGFLASIVINVLLFAWPLWTLVSIIVGVIYLLFLSRR